MFRPRVRPPVRLRTTIGLLLGLCSCTAILGDFSVESGSSAADGGADTSTIDGDGAPGDAGDGADAEAGTLLFSGVKGITVGARHSCAVTNGGEVFCWGDNSDGQIAQGAEARAVRPKKVLFPVDGGVAPKIAEVVAGYFHTCAITDGPGGAGDMYCWGRNACGQTGAGDTTSPSPTPRPVKTVGNLQWASAAAGIDHTCAIETGGATYCWGCNTRGQAGALPLGTPTLIPTNAGADKASYSGHIATSVAHSCAAPANGSGGACWGIEDRGQLGNGGSPDEQSQAALVVTTGAQVRQLGLGERHSCALDSDGNVACWGDNSRGQLGILTDGGVGIVAPSGKIPGGVRSFVSAKGDNTCFITQGTVACVGDNRTGQLGRGTTDPAPHPLPQAVQGPGAATATLTGVAVAVGREHVCAITDNARVVCWGNGADGQLGDGTAGGLPRPAPVRVLPPQ